MARTGSAMAMAVADNAAARVAQAISHKAGASLDAKLSPKTRPLAVKNSVNTSACKKSGGARRWR